MKNKILSLFVVLTLLFMASIYFKKSDEKALVECVNKVSTSLNIIGLKTDVSGRVDSPIISGKTSTKDKQAFKQLITEQCQIHSFEDLIVEENEFDLKIAHINFKLDGFNQVGTITGIVNSVNEQQETLANFTDALNKHYGPWTIMHDIIVSKQVDNSEFSINISLVFAAISLIRVTDITLTNNQIIVKGLVRSKSDEQQSISQLQQIFQSDLEIVNQLEAVVKEAGEAEELEIELTPFELPEIKPPKGFDNNNQ